MLFELDSETEGWDDFSSLNLDLETGWMTLFDSPEDINNAPTVAREDEPPQVSIFLKESDDEQELSVFDSSNILDEVVEEDQNQKPFIQENTSLLSDTNIFRREIRQRLPIGHPAHKPSLKGVIKKQSHSRSSSPQPMRRPLSCSAPPGMFSDSTDQSPKVKVFTVSIPNNSRLLSNGTSFDLISNKSLSTTNPMDCNIKTMGLLDPHNDVNMAKSLDQNYYYQCLERTKTRLKRTNPSKKQRIKSPTDNPCPNCHTITSTLWRNCEIRGKSLHLCNACGLRYKKGKFCPLCCYVYYDTEPNSRDWERCTKCNHWSHKFCLQNDNSSSSVTSNYVCPLCR